MILSLFFIPGAEPTEIPPDPDHECMQILYTYVDLAMP